MNRHGWHMGIHLPKESETKSKKKRLLYMGRGNDS